MAGGPVLTNSVALAMVPHVGRILLLVSENNTYIADIDAAQNALELCGAREVSLVMTEAAGLLR